MVPSPVQMLPPAARQKTAMHRAKVPYGTRGAIYLGFDIGLNDGVHLARERWAIRGLELYPVDGHFGEYARVGGKDERGVAMW